MGNGLGKQFVTTLGNKEVTFICPDGQMAIRLTDNDSSAIVIAAHQLKATHFICVDDWDFRQNLPVWAVFETRKVTRLTVSTWSLPIPMKLFTTETSDPAVMWALVMQGKS